MATLCLSVNMRGSFSLGVPRLGPRSGELLGAGSSDVSCAAGWLLPGLVVWRVRDLCLAWSVLAPGELSSQSRTLTSALCRSMKTTKQQLSEYTNRVHQDPKEHAGCEWAYCGLCVWVRMSLSLYVSVCTFARPIVRP